MQPWSTSKITKASVDRLTRGRLKKTRTGSTNVKKMSWKTFAPGGGAASAGRFIGSTDKKSAPERMVEFRRPHEFLGPSRSIYIPCRRQYSFGLLVATDDAAKP